MAPLPQFLLFGDSLTEGSNDQSKGFAFASALQHEYLLKLDVINRGFSGYTTAHGLSILPTFFPLPSQANVRFLTIFFGANDSILSKDGAQLVPLSEFEANIKTLLSHPLITAHQPDIHIILITPPPVEENVTKRLDDECEDFDPITRRQSNTAKYAEAVWAVGEETGTPVVDVWSSFMEKAGWKRGSEDPYPGTLETGLNDVLAGLLVDGLHFTPAGYEIMFEEVMKVIRTTWPDHAPEKLDTLFREVTW